MIKFILIVIALYFILSNPWLILVVGGILLTWRYCSKKETARLKEGPIITPPPKEKNFTTYQERMDKTKEEIKTKEKDLTPEEVAAQEEVKKAIREQMDRNKEVADRELKLEMLREAEGYALKGEWNKVDKIEREIRDMESKSDS
jgi:hypothetical protein